MDLYTDDEGCITFAALSWNSPKPSRLDNLSWFYAQLARHDVAAVLHLGVGSATLPPLYSPTEAIQTILVDPATPTHLALVHAPTGRRTRLQPLFDRDHARSFTAIAAEYENAWDPKIWIDWGGPERSSAARRSEGLIDSEIILVGGHGGTGQHRYFAFGRRCIASIGVFDAPPGKPAGGTIFDVALNPAGQLEACVMTFLDMSEGGRGD